MILGWESLSAVSNRCVYAGVAEVSVYISEKHKGKGVGTSLLNYLIQQSEKEGFWTLSFLSIGELLLFLKRFSTGNDFYMFYI